MRSAPRSRRDVLHLAASAALAAITLPVAAFATPEQVTEEINKISGGKKIGEGKLQLDLPSIAENGLVVPLTFDVESPMTEADHVKAVYLFAEGNPQVNVATFHFTPMSPKASGALRIRLAQSQNVVAIALMSNGDVYRASKEVKVTIGGCGG